MRSYFVYILKCSDNTFYTGVTNDLNRRLEEHYKGMDPNCYTAKRRPVDLVFSQEFVEVKQAISFEKKIKSWGSKKKMALINGNWDSLKKLAECKNETSHKNFGMGFDSAQPDK